MTTENWLPVPGYEGLYSVSDQGRVRSEDRVIGADGGRTRQWKGRELSVKPVTATRGRGRRYPRVCLWKENVKTVFLVHQLVLAAFVGPRPQGMECLHADDDPNNNCLSNLRYGTHADNGKDMTANRTHCINGHEFTTESTYLRPDNGYRQCKTCKRSAA